MANTSKGYNGNTDFLKWYKGMYGADYDKDTGLVRKEGMSDGDWDVGTILHNYYIKNQQNEADRQENIGAINERYDGMIETAREGFDSSRRTLGENKSVAQQNASITYDKLKKYLPMKQQAQGLGGLGTQSAELDAYNRYMSQMGGIASDYQGNMRAIDDSETKTVGELERYRTDSLEENDNLYDSLARTYGDNADKDASAAWKSYLAGEKDRRDEAYAMAQSILSKSTSGSVEELMAYVSSLEGKVSPEQFTALQNYAKSVAEGNYKKATEDQTNKQQSDYNNAYNMALGVLQSATTDNPEELMAYVNSLEGKVSPEQLAALRQIATNVAGANLKTSEDRNEARTTVMDEFLNLIYNEDYTKAKSFLDSNKEIIGDYSYDAYSKIIDSWVDEKITSGEKTIDYDGTTLRLNLPVTTKLEEALDKNDLLKIKADGYSGPYDPNIPNGTTYAIKIGGVYGFITCWNGKWYSSTRGDGKTAYQVYLEELEKLSKDPTFKGEIQPSEGTESSAGNGSSTGGTVGGSSGRGNSSSGISTNSFLKAYANTPQYDSLAAQGGAAFIEWLMNLFDK